MYQELIDKLRAEFPDVDVNIDLWMHNTDDIFNVNFIAWVGKKEVKIVCSIGQEDDQFDSFDSAITALKQRIKEVDKLPTCKLCGSKATLFEKNNTAVHDGEKWEEKRCQLDRMVIPESQWRQLMDDKDLKEMAVLVNIFNEIHSAYCNCPNHPAGRGHSLGVKGCKYHSGFELARSIVIVESNE